MILILKFGVFIGLKFQILLQKSMEKLRKMNL